MEHPDPQAIFAFALNELQGEGRKAVGDHIAFCKSCSELYTELTSRETPLSGDRARSHLSRFSPAERIRSDDDRRQFARPVRAIIVMTLIGIVGFFFVGALFIGDGPSSAQEFQKEEYDLAVVEARYLEGEGRYDQALSRYGHAAYLYLIHYGTQDDVVTAKMQAIHLKKRRLEAGRRQYDMFVKYLAESKPGDLPGLLREGQFLRTEYLEDNVPWMPELEKVLARLEKVGKAP